MTTCADPTLAEMQELLDEGGFEESDIAEAIYWFASDWHSGQMSNLYSALLHCGHRPGPLATGPEYAEAMEACEFLELTFTRQEDGAATAK